MRLTYHSPAKPCRVSLSRPLFGTAHFLCLLLFCQSFLLLPLTQLFSSSQKSKKKPKSFPARILALSSQRTRSQLPAWAANILYYLWSFLLTGCDLSYTELNKCACSFRIWTFVALHKKNQAIHPSIHPLLRHSTLLNWRTEHAVSVPLTCSHLDSTEEQSMHEVSVPLKPCSFSHSKDHPLHCTKIAKFHQKKEQKVDSESQNVVKWQSCSMCLFGSVISIIKLIISSQIILD